MSEEVDKHVLRKYEVQQKLGKGVRSRPLPCTRAPCPPLPARCPPCQLPGVVPSACPLPPGSSRLLGRGPGSLTPHPTPTPIYHNSWALLGFSGRPGGG